MNGDGMNGSIVSPLREQTRELRAAELVEYIAGRFGPRVALASSLSAEDQVLTHMLVQRVDEPRVFTLDTGRLPQETYDVLEETRRRYDLDIEVLYPDREALEELVGREGPNCFRRSVQMRKRCCHVRKVVPLKRKLATLDAWITGLRREQATTRTDVHRVEWDAGNGLVKVNPLANWSTDAVWAYIHEHNVPYNALHDAGYPSIGCAPCTRAVGPEEDIRAGRWWWEAPEHKECGLHRAQHATTNKEA
jgi:phosphoadenosine phosphosulfate reductase